MAWVKSNNVVMFPSSLRGNVVGSTGNKWDPQSRFTTEPNLTGFVNRLADKDSFIITANSTNIVPISTSGNYEFNIHGYYFKIIDTNAIFGSSGSFTASTSVYAIIRLDGLSVSLPSSPSVSINTLVTAESTSSKILDTGSDTTSDFKGLLLSNSNSGYTASPYYALLIATRANTSASWSIPTSSKLKFSANYISLPGQSNPLSDLFDSDNASVNKAIKLTNARTFWGQSFDGTALVDGSLINTGSITPKATDISSIGSGALKYKDITLKNASINENGDIVNAGNTSTTGTISGNVVKIMADNTSKDIKSVFGASLGGDSSSKVSLLNKDGTVLSSITVDNVTHSTNATKTCFSNKSWNRVMINSTTTAISYSGSGDIEVWITYPGPTPTDDGYAWEFGIGHFARISDSGDSIFEFPMVADLIHNVFYGLEIWANSDRWLNRINFYQITLTNTGVTKTRITGTNYYLYYKYID